MMHMKRQSLNTLLRVKYSPTVHFNDIVKVFQSIRDVVVGK